MRHMVTGLVAKPVEAQQIIDELTSSCACDRADISLIGRADAGNVAAGTATRAVQATVGAASIAGSAAARTLQDMLQAAAGASRPTSVFGALSAAGHVASVLSRSTLDTAADLANAFVDFGLQEEAAHEYAEALRQGSILLIVHARSEKMAECARQVLASRGVHAGERPQGGAGYAQSGSRSMPGR